MALVVKDRVRVTSLTSGTGTFTLGSAVSGFQDFSVIGNGNTTYYAIVDSASGAWEVGLGTYTASGTTLSRDTILESSTGGTAVNFNAGVKDVFCTYPAEKSVYLDASDVLNATTVDTTNLEVTNIKAKDGTAAVSIADSTGKVTITTELAVDNLNLSGNAITSTNSNGNIALTPNGSGEVDISKVDIAGGEIDAVTLGTNSAVTEAQIDNINIDGNTISTTDTDGDLILSPDGTGAVQEEVGGTNYDLASQFDVGTAPNEIPLNQYLGDLAYQDAANVVSLGIPSGSASLPSLFQASDTNTGVFFPAADTVGIATDGTEQMRITSAGSVGIGGTPASSQSGLRVSTSLAGGTIVYQVTSQGSVQSDATTEAVYFRTFASTAASAFTLADLTHYRAEQGTVGAGSTVTYQYGFRAMSSLTGATNNYGFYGNIASAAGRYNFYAAGTADNYFAGTIASLGSYTATTANAANMNIDSSGNIARSTSSIRYKKDVETLESQYADAVVAQARPVWYRSKSDADNANWGWYGLIAEEVAEIDPRLVHWGYPTKTVEHEPAVEAKEAVLDEEGNEIEPAVQAQEATYKEVPDTDAELQAEGVQYDRLTVLLLDVVKRQGETIKALEARVSALENGV